ncbi:MAG: hypothetical protein R3A10_05115 [Caldilineaceae bacterium]
MRRAGWHPTGPALPHGRDRFLSDEIDKLKASMADIADELARLPEQPDVRYGLVAYRDHGDEFVVRNFDFTDSLPQFQRTSGQTRCLRRRR